MAGTPLTAADITAGYEDGRWLGWGYLGERERVPAEQADAGDAVALELANEQGWDRETFFHWLNSKTGRWFADEAFHGAGLVRDRLRGYFTRMDFLP